MDRSKLAALIIAVLVIGLGVGRTATASHNANHKVFSGGPASKGTVVKTSSSAVSVTAFTPNWQTVDSRGFQIPAGETQLVVVNLAAQITCFNAQCLARALIGEALGTAALAEPGEVVMTQAVAGVDDQSFPFAAALCVRNATASPANVSVWVQGAGNNSNVTFSIDKYTLEIARHSPCSPFVDI